MVLLVTSVVVFEARGDLCVSTLFTVCPAGLQCMLLPVIHLQTQLAP